MSKLQQALEELKTSKTDKEKSWYNLKIEGLIWDWAILSHLERLLKSFKRNETGTKHIRDGLRNSDQFYQTLNELELFANAKSKHRVVPEPSVGTKNLDLSITLKREILVEAICPEMYKPLRFLTGAVGIENTARERILDEVHHHLEHVPDNFDKPIIVAIDVSRSEIDYDSVQDALLGSFSIRMYVEKISGKFVGYDEARKKDDVSEESPETQLVSAVLFYRRRLGKGVSIQLEGDIVANPKAKNPLNADEFEILKHDLLSPT